MSLRSASPLRAALPFVLIALLAAAWSAYWLILSKKVQDLYATEEAILAAKGTALTCASREWGGYPFRITLNCAGPAFIMPAKSGRVTVASGNLLVLMQAYDWRHFIALLDGPTEVRQEGQPAIAVTHGRASASLVVRGDGAARLAVEIPQPNSPEVGSAEFVVVNTSLDPGGTIAASASAARPVIRQNLAADSASVEISLPASLATARDPIAAAAAGGAPLELRHFEAKIGDLSVFASGEMSLTPEGKPQGTVTAAVSDLGRLATLLKNAPALAGDNMASIRTVLEALSGNRANAKIALKVNAGALYWGPLKIADLPSLL
jgi:hypothetical protein